MVALRRPRPDRMRRNPGTILGIAEVSRAGAQGEPQRVGVPLYAHRRKDDAARRTTASDAVDLSVSAGLPDVQRLRDVAVQEDAGRHPQSGASEVEARDAP